LETAGRSLFHHINLSLPCAPREGTQGSRGIATVVIDLHDPANLPSEKEHPLLFY